MEWIKAFSILMGRILLVLIFLNSGIGKIGNFAVTEKYMAQFSMPWTSFFLLGAIFLELVGSITVIFGYFTRFGALLLIIFLIPATLIFHSNFSDRIQMIMFMKNVSMLGGCLMLLGEGPGKISLDYIIRGRKKI
ncbi:MAG: DoxX family protein [Thermodesulfobacteriota bacterium]